jgi:hypothetical protein
MTKPTQDYPDNSEWARDDRETDQQVTTLERVYQRQQAAKKLALPEVTAPPIAP